MPAASSSPEAPVAARPTAAGASQEVMPPAGCTATTDGSGAGVRTAGVTGRAGVGFGVAGEPSGPAVAAGLDGPGAGSGAGSAGFSGLAEVRKVLMPERLKPLTACAENWVMDAGAVKDQLPPASAGTSSGS